MDSLKKNIISSYASYAYITIIGIAAVPFYIKHMGVEAYGLVSFFTMLQAWFNLLDLGLSPTIARESARYHGGAMTALAYRQLFRSLNILFSCISVIGGGTLLLFSDLIAMHWLSFKTLAIPDVVFAVQIMSVSVALRWMEGLYRGVISGAEKFVWLNNFNSLMASLRFIGVFLSMWIWGFTPFVFFVHQLITATFEALGLLSKSRMLLPKKSNLNRPIGWSFRPIMPLLRFSLTLAFTSSVWVMVTQIDKLVLSGTLPLTEYGYFSLAVLVASGVMIIGGPVSGTIMPRMARLHAEGKYDELINVYRTATQLVSVAAGSVATTLAFCAKPLLYGWTGNLDLATNAAPILRLYAMGNGLLAVSAFPYYMQYAKGNLRYHLIGNFLMAVALIPGIIYATVYFGGIGAGYVWLGMNAFFLFVWLGYVHGKLEPGLHLPWLWQDILSIAIPAVLISFLCGFIPFQLNSRSGCLFYVLVVAIFSSLFSAIMAPVTQRQITTWISNKNG